MCHLILMMPVLALPVFWFMPFSVAGPVYAVVLIISAWLYYWIMRAMRRPVETGLEKILHSTGEVIDVQGESVRVRLQGESWEAESPDSLHPGDRVQVVSIHGLVLEVRRPEPLASHGGG
jgi:membrane protein implicated in regulation of membrane protease activity